MTDELMTVREVAEYLNLNEKKVYSLIRSSGIPCTKITGKWLFPKRQVDLWIEMSIRPEGEAGELEKVTIIGSHDPSIEVLASCAQEIYPGLTVLSAHVGSMQGLETLRRGECTMAGVHLLDPETGFYNYPWIDRLLSGKQPVVIQFVGREQGLIVAAGNPLGIEGLEDLAGGRARFINRQEGSGTRHLLDHRIEKLDIDPETIEGYGRTVSSHSEVALAVREGSADAGLGVRAAASSSSLEFIPVARERFDFVTLRKRFYSEPVQKIIEVIRSRQFRDKVLEMGGYDLAGSGKILEWGHGEWKGER